MFRGQYKCPNGDMSPLPNASRRKTSESELYQNSSVDCGLNKGVVSRQIFLYINPQFVNTNLLEVV